MTCIVGLVHNSRVIIGGDSIGVADWDYTIRRDPKVFQVGPYLIGGTTSFRMLQLLRFSLSVPEQLAEHDDDRHMTTVFIDAVRRCLKDGGYTTIVNNTETSGDFLVGYRGHLYRIGENYQVAVAACGFQALGCGFAYALGSLHETPDLAPHERVRSALTAAERFSIGVAGPFIIQEAV